MNERDALLKVYRTPGGIMLSSDRTVLLRTCTQTRILLCFGLTQYYTYMSANIRHVVIVLDS